MFHVLSTKMLSNFCFFNGASRNLFMIALQYKAPLNEVENHLEAHREFLKICYQKKIFITSGRKEPRTGGIIIASARDKKTLEEVLANDPFKQHNIATYEITEFVPTMYDEALTEIVKKDDQITNRFSAKR